jgi:hypothetical protein
MGVDGESRQEASSTDEQTETVQLPVPVDGTIDKQLEARSLPSEPVEPRPYIEIRPSETMVDPSAVTRAMEHLHGLLQDLTQTGLIHSLRRSKRVPLVEWLIVSDGRVDPQLRYLVGTTHSDLTDDLLGILRTCFPNTYELRQVMWHPRDAEEYLPLIDPASGAQEITLSTGETIDTTVQPYIAGVEYSGHTERRRDWQTPLQSYGHAQSRRPGGRGPSRHTPRLPQTDREESHRTSLAALVETIRDASLPIVYQVVCHAHRDWSTEADTYISDLETGSVTLGDAILDTIFPRSSDDKRDYEPPLSDRNRIEAIATRDPSRTFQVSARAVVLTRSDASRANTVARRLASSLSGVSGPFYTVRGEIRTDDELHTKATPPGTAIFSDLIGRAVYSASYETFRSRLPRKHPNSRGLVVAPAELPGLCLIDWAGLTPNGKRALAARPREQTGLRLPPPHQLIRYTPPGMALCMPLTHDREPYGQAFYLPATQQDRHIVVVGDTGSGKSVLLETGVLTNVTATDGPEIIFDYKGGGTAEEYLRIHFATYGTLDDVLYFDLSRVLPALSVFDVEPLLEAGIPREEARSRKAGHYEEILQGLMGAEKYGEAAESVKAIRNHLRALYDPVHGSDAISHTDLYEALQKTQRGEGMPETSDEQLSPYFTGLAERDRDVFNMILGGAVGRVEQIANDGRLAPLFNYVPESTDTTADGDEADAQASFKFSEIINQNRIVIFDFGGMEGKIKRALTLVLLSNLWTALKARQGVTEAKTQVPQVNLYLEEARDIGATKLLDALLAEGRSFGLSVALGLQFLEQLESPNPDSNTYQEALNETATFVVGNVTVDTDLPQALATDEMSREALATRLSAMSRGEWLIRPGTDFGAEAVRPFLAESLQAPPGHPASEHPLSASKEQTFQQMFADMRRTTEMSSGLRHEKLVSEPVEEDDPAETREVEDDKQADATESTHPALRVDTLLTHSTRMPEAVSYDPKPDALQCISCGNRYDPTIDGMVRAIKCCHELEEFDPDDIPVCEFNLKLSPEEILGSDYSLKQLLFIQAVYNAQQRRYDPREYDLRNDSMIRLEEYVGIETEEIEELLDADILRKDTDYPHRMYSVAPDGRSVIGEAYRAGIDFGHGKGDLDESTNTSLASIWLRIWLISILRPIQPRMSKWFVGITICGKENYRLRPSWGQMQMLQKPSVGSPNVDSMWPVSMPMGMLWSLSRLRE